MKLSSKTMYALRALFDITFHSHGKATKIDAIAARENVPPRFLEQIFQDLKAAQIVGSKRGPNGGYFLLRSPETITIGQVVRAMEGVWSILAASGATRRCARSARSLRSV